MFSRYRFSIGWLAGSAIAATQIALASSSGCGLPQQGRCTLCGGCVVALAGLGGWAFFKRVAPGQKVTVKRERPL